MLDAEVEQSDMTLVRLFRRIAVDLLLVRSVDCFAPCSPLARLVPYRSHDLQMSRLFQSLRSAMCTAVGDS